MSVLRYASVLLIFLSFQVRGQGLGAELSLAMSASPTENLHAGQPIDVTLSVTNSGPDAAPVVVMYTPPFHDQISLLPVNADECLLYTITLDYPGGVDYVIGWTVAAYGGQGDPLRPGEARTCHFQIALNESARPDFVLTFALVSNTDADPSNDAASVDLQFGAATLASVPAVSKLGLWMLALLICVCASVGGKWKRFPVASVRNAASNEWLQGRALPSLSQT